MAFTFSELLEPLAGITTATQIILGLDNTEALLVRNAADTIDVFNVNTVSEIVGLSSAAELRWSTDLKLFRDGPWELALRDGTNENYLHIYKTFTDASNFERLRIEGGGPNPRFNLIAQTAGTGADNLDIALVAAGFNSRVELVQNTTNILSWGENILELLPSGQSAFRGPSSVLTQLTTAAGGSATQIGVMAQALSGTLSSGSTFTFTNIIPAGSFVFGVTIRVDTTITGPTSIDVGDGTDVDRWGAGIALVAPTLTNIQNFTTSAVTTFQTANDVVITANGGDFTAGEIRCVVHYLTLVPAVT